MSDWQPVTLRGRDYPEERFPLSAGGSLDSPALVVYQVLDSATGSALAAAGENDVNQIPDINVGIQINLCRGIAGAQLPRLDMIAFTNLDTLGNVTQNRHN